MKHILFALIFLLLLPACSKHSGPTVTVVKPKYHHRFYDRKKDKRTARTKTVRVKN